MAAFKSDSANLFTESLIDLENQSRLKWCGNMRLKGYWSIQEEIKKILEKKAIPISLGGDHSITYPILKAIHAALGKVNILHFDAHSDLYDELNGNRYSHACPFARIMEDGLAKSLTQVGIRTLNKHQKEQADRFNVKIIDMKNWSAQTLFDIEGPVYISFDMDVLDPAFAPGVSHHEPGGFSTREVLQMLQNLNLNIIGCDLVEYNPERDQNGMTAMVAAKVLKELLDQLIKI